MGFLKVDYSKMMLFLEKGEVIKDSISGDFRNIKPGNEKERKGMLAATDRRLIFLEKGDEVKGVDSFLYTQLKECIEGRGYAGFPLKFTVGGKTYEMFANRRGNVRHMAAVVKAQLERMASEAQMGTIHSAIYTDIEKLTEMRDKGTISQEEYETKKKELLTRI